MFEPVAVPSSADVRTVDILMSTVLTFAAQEI
jgi:hypothetical protein